MFTHSLVLRRLGAHHLRRFGARAFQRLAAALPWQRLPASDPLRNALFRRVWGATFLGGLGLQLMMLALPLSAAVLLQATPAQMGLLVACEALPLALLGLPAGVWLDRVRKLPVYLGGELLVAAAALSIPLAWWAGWLGMAWLCGVALVLGLVNAVGVSAAQIVLSMTVPREQLVQAHARNAIATSGAELLGPGLAGWLLKAAGAPLAMGINAMVMLASALMLRGLKLNEPQPARRDPGAGTWWPELRAGLAFVARTPLLVALAVCVSVWQLAYHMVLVVQILFATRELGLSEDVVAMCFAAVGAGTVAASALSHGLSQRLGPGLALGCGAALTGLAWLALALVPAQPWGGQAFALALVAYGAGTGVLFVGFFALRQAVTPVHLLGRMTSVMRWLTLLPAAPGALLGGWLGEQFGLRVALGAAGLASIACALLVLAWPVLRHLRGLPVPADVGSRPGAAA